jgi:citrate synthase
MNPREPSGEQTTQRKSRRPEVRQRGIRFANRWSTRIWSERGSPQNPYVAEECRCHGYDLLELVKGRSFAEVLYLLFRGELPGPAQTRLLEATFVALINPGPRHPATRAAMVAGIGKTDPAHILPIALSVLGGQHGGTEVAETMRFLLDHRGTEAPEIAQNLLATASPAKEGDWHIVPGFGSHFGSPDIMPARIAHVLLGLEGGGEALRWGQAFADALSQANLGWLITGVAAAAFVDLGFHPRAGAGLFQFAASPGLLTHGLELANKPITAMPFVDQDHYVIEPKREHG